MGAEMALAQDTTSSAIAADRQEIELLKQKIEELDQRLQAEEKLQATKDQDAAAKAKAGVSLDAVSSKVDGLEGKLKDLGPFHFSGDLRLRHESFLGGGPADGAPARTAIASATACASTPRQS